MDARPHPAFPARADVWADGASWRLGHWLNGRAGLSGLGEVVLDVCARAGFTDVDVTTLRGAVSGYVVDALMSARDALEPLMAAYDFTAAEREGRVSFFHREARDAVEIDANDMSAASIGEPYAQRGDAQETAVEARARRGRGAGDCRAASRRCFDTQSRRALCSDAAARGAAPVGARACAGDIAISWVRCARVGGDSWGAGEPPLGEPAETYLLEVLDGGGAVVRTAGALSSPFIYTAAQQSADFGTPPASLRIRIAQLASSGAPGLNKELTIPL